jgi:cobalt-zinc-cadmium efflux system membrane fusion protein
MKEQGKLDWQIQFTTDPKEPPAMGKVEAISPLIDPTQHTGVVMGWVDNSKARLRSSQFVIAKIDLPAPENTAAIPTTALVEDGTDSIVFVQPDPKKAEYQMKRVVVTKRFSDQVFVKSQLIEEEIKKGFSPLTPGVDRVVTQGALEMKDALDDVRAKAGKH